MSTLPFVTPDINFFYPIPGMKLKDDRYTVLRKLGSGRFSSAWLVFEKTESDAGKGVYSAAKFLTREATEAHRSGISGELEFLKAVTEDEVFPTTALPDLWDDFEVRGPEGVHLCLVMKLLSSDVSSFRRSAPSGALRPYFVKNIIGQVLEALTKLHRLDIIHTDIKGDNILFDGVAQAFHVEKILEEDPTRAVAQFELEGGMHPVFESQPIPHTFKWDTPHHYAELALFSLIDLGHAQRAGEQPTVDLFSSPELRAPELILRSDFGPKIDIWAVGCLTFELLTGHWLFKPEEGETWSIDDDHLAKMMELTGERFNKTVLDRAQLRAAYFDDEGNLLRITQLSPVSIENALENYRVLPVEEIEPAAEFIRTCLRLDSSERPPAKELELHPWLKGAFCG